MTQPSPKTPQDERLDLVVRAAGVGVWLNPLPLGELDWNDNVKAHFHLPPDARVDIETFFARLHPDDRERVRAAVDLAVSRGAAYEELFRTVGPSGKVKWIRAIGRVSYDEAGQPTKFDGITLDLTERVNAEHRMRSLADTAPAMLWVTEPDGRCSFLSRAWSEFTGQPEAEGLGHGWLQMVHPQDRDAAGARFMEANRRRQPFAMEHRVRGADGQWRWVIDAGRPRVASDGEFCGFVGSVTDIDARRSAEDELRLSRERLRESDERYRAFVANSTEGIWRVEFDPPVDTRLPAARQVDQVFAQGRFAECNEAFARMYGYSSASQVIGRGLELMMDPADPGARAYLEGVMAAGYRASEIESEERDSRGAPLWFANSLVGVVEEGWLVRAWGTQRNVTDRKRAEQALLEADRRKDEFLATLAHELRNPLAPIRNVVEAMRRRSPAESAVQREHEVIDRQVTHLARLVDDLMDVSRITRNRLELRPGPVRVQDVVKLAVEASRPDLEARRQVLQVDLPAEDVWLHADEVRLVQVLMNLLTNAAKYSGAGTRIEVAAQVDGGVVEVRVRDQGGGIAAGELGRVFDLFYQVPGGAQETQGGLGIGLSLVQRLVELHGGTVEARSAGLGLGSEFSVRLPVATRQEVRERGAETPAAATPAGARRFLVVDDNRDSADTLAELLRIMGHEVQAAYDGEEGVAAAAAFQPEVVLLDLGMPRLDGYEACRRLRASEGGANLRLIAVSGWGQAADRARTRAAGFDAHLVKPVALDDLLKILAPEAG